MVLAIAAIWQGCITRRQIKANEQQLKISARQATSGEKSASAAVDVHRESIRARVDQFAPRVVAFFEKPEGPYWNTAQTGIPYANDNRLLDRQATETPRNKSHEFVFPQDSGTFLWFRGRGALINEGETSARVRLETQWRFIEGVNFITGEFTPLPHLTDNSINSEAILPPGAAALFEWADGHTVGEWADAYSNPEPPRPGGDIWLWITVFDPRGVGVIDTIEARFAPEVISPVSSRVGHWMVNDSSHFGPVYALPITREYVNEGANTENLKHMRQHFRAYEEKLASEGENEDRS
ncbi:hypothetical protein [Brevibacterium sanguinis]|nr:hypothetical protein [Brevibacterium sanguinis]